MSSEKDKTRYSDEELEEFDQLILENLEKARDQLAFYQEQLEELTEQGEARIKGLDDGAGTSEAERLNAMVSRTQKYIKHLENSRVRIANKVYGVCRETGRLISKERLKVVPHATLSIEAKQGKRGDQ